MRSLTQRSLKTNSIRGTRFNQESLRLLELNDKVAGQQIFFKLVLFVLALLLYIIAGGVAGYVGGAIGLYVCVEVAGSPAVRVASVIVITVLATATFQDQQKSILVAVVALCLVIGISGLLAAIGSLADLSRFLITVTAATGLLLGLSSISFLTMRFLIALVDILFARNSSLKLTSILIAVLATFIGVLTLISGEAQTQDSYWKALLTSVDVRTKVIAIGVAYGLSLVMCAWLANFLKRTPWNYPSLLRAWAIAVGSWRGTSFVNLDLSEVNFRGSTLVNTDLRAQTLYRTCFQEVTGLERARVDNQYLDLEAPKVQQLLTHACSADHNFQEQNLRGAYLQNADMRGFDLTDTNLTGADLKGADLRGSRLIRTQLAGADLQGVDLRTNILIDANLTEANLRRTDLRDCILVRAQVARADFTGADLTGACIEDWSISSKTTFVDVRCDYVFRRYENGQPTHRYPSDRSFELGEFAALFQQLENELELIFKGEFSYNALSLAFYKLKTEKPELDLELKGIEQRGNLWVVRVTSNNPTVEAQLERQLSEVYQNTTENESLKTTIKTSIYRNYEDVEQRLAESQQLVRQLAGISERQAEALKQLSKQAFGTNFYIEGSAITNLTGQGQIEYTEAAGQLRSFVSRGGTEAQIFEESQQILSQLQDIATTPLMQTELIQQILLKEAQSDPAFRHFLVQQQQQILTALPPGTTASAIKAAIELLIKAE